MTRAATFRHLHSVARRSNAAVRIWDCGSHGNLHAKLYCWGRPDGSATIWIGSANLTDGGLQNEGELVAEMSCAPGEATIAAVRKAFNREWERATAISDTFLRGYRESPRAIAFTDVVRRRRTRPERSQSVRVGRRMFVATASEHYGDNSRVATRVDELLGGTAEAWYRGPSRLLEQVRAGDWCLYIDTVDADVQVVSVTDVAPDGRYVIFAFEELSRWRPFTGKLRESLAGLGLRRTKDSLATQWVPGDKIISVAKLVHPKWRLDQGSTVVR